MTDMEKPVEDNSGEKIEQGEPVGLGTDVQGVKPELDVKAVKRSKKPEDIRCDLTESEIAERGSKLAKLHRKIELLEEEKKGQTQHYAQLIKEASLELKKMSDAVNNRYEFRTVVVETITDYNAGTVTRFRMDTGDELDHRKLTTAEAQLRIEVVDKREEPTLTMNEKPEDNKKPEPPKGTPTQDDNKKPAKKGSKKK